MIFRELEEGDLEAVSERSISHGVKEWPSFIDLSFALEHDGVVIGIGGLKMLNPASAWAWVDLTDIAAKNIYSAYRVISEWFEILVKKVGVTRVMAAVECDFDRAILTVEHLGFERESLMPGFFGDKDGWMYVRMFEKVEG